MKLLPLISAAKEDLPFHLNLTQQYAAAIDDSSELVSAMVRTDCLQPPKDNLITNEVIGRYRDGILNPRDEVLANAFDSRSLFPLADHLNTNALDDSGERCRDLVQREFSREELIILAIIYSRLATALTTNGLGEPNKNDLRQNLLVLSAPLLPLGTPQESVSLPHAQLASKFSHASGIILSLLFKSK